MEIRFRTRRLQRCYERQAEAQKRWGPKVARKYVERINILCAATSTADLATLPQLRFHPLKGKRQGQHAVDLDEQMRLILTVKEEASEPVVTVEDVSKHYGD